MRLVAFARGLIAAALLLAATPLGAHHPFASVYDPGQFVLLRGTVTKVDWAYPHARIYLQVKGEHDLFANWAVEAAAPDVLVKKGWRVETLSVGNVITVEGYRARNGNPAARARVVTLPDGRRFVLATT